MGKSRRQGRQKNRQGFETASTLLLGRVRVRRQPKTRNSQFVIRTLLLLLLIAVIAGLLWLTLDDRFYVYHADVVGTARVAPEEVFRASGLLGLHSLWVRPAEIEARILAELPALESAQIACGRWRTQMRRDYGVLQLLTSLPEPSHMSMSSPSSQAAIRRWAAVIGGGRRIPSGSFHLSSAVRTSLRGNQRTSSTSSGSIRI